MKNSIVFKKGEGTLSIDKDSEDNVLISYCCIDDYASKRLSTDDFMKMLGYVIES